MVSPGQTQADRDEAVGRPKVVLRSARRRLDGWSRNEPPRNAWLAIYNISFIFFILRRFASRH